MPKEKIYNGNLKDLEIKIAVLAETHRKDIERVEEQTELKFDATAKALLIDTKEMARRLDFLNGEAERLRQMQATYLPREVYDENRREIMKCLSDLEGFKNNALGRQSVITVVVSAIVSLVFIFLNYILTGVK